MSTGVTSSRGSVKEAPAGSPAATMGEVEIFRTMLKIMSVLTEIERKLNILLAPKLTLWQRLFKFLGGRS